MKKKFPLIPYIILALLIACVIMAFVSGALDTSGAVLLNTFEG